MTKEMDVFKRDDLFEKAIPSEVFADVSRLAYVYYTHLIKKEIQEIVFYLNWRTEDFADVICRIERDGESYFFLFSLQVKKDRNELEKPLKDLAEGIQEKRCPFVIHKIVGDKILPLDEFYQHPQVV